MRNRSTQFQVARSWASALRLADVHPHLTFAFSQAIQVAWLREDYPSLYQRLVTAVKSGRFIPVGGLWVEMDGNIPSGESFCRQMLYGQQEFMKSFGRYCDVFWLPDTFGYSAQLPQLMRQAGMERFLTQKMSWNLVNKFPHHSFLWEGIDGSAVLTHFPPADSYACEISVKEAMHSANNFADKGRSSVGLWLYGYGDGGGGVDEAMLQRLSRLSDVTELPKVKPSSPSSFFDILEAERENLCVWRGELYLELHNGTYTSQAKVKTANRRMELALRDVEMLEAIKLLSGSGPEMEVRNWETEWKKVLLNQFHDVLPGTSIPAVYEDAHNLYREVEVATQAVLSSSKPRESDPVLFNSLSWERKLITDDGRRLILPPLSLTRLEQLVEEPKGTAVTAELVRGNIELRNQHLSATITPNGQISSLAIEGDARLKESREFTITDRPLNQFLLYDDVPLFWDAWDVMDYHLETGRVIATIDEPAEIVESTPHRAIIQLGLKIGDKSWLKQRILLQADSPYIEFETDVEWRESHKFLKVTFPINIRPGSEALFETQFGHLKRPTSKNQVCQMNHSNLICPADIDTAVAYWNHWTWNKNRTYFFSWRL